MNLTNKYISGSSSHRQDLFGQLLTPSWLSGLLVVVISLTIVVGSISRVYYQSSSLQLLVWQHNNESHSIQNAYQPAGSTLSASALIENIPLFIFWGTIGVLIFLFVLGVLKALHKTRQLREEIYYVNADSQALLKQATIRLLVRVGVLLAWFFYIKYTLHTIIPYAITISHVGITLAGILYKSVYFMAAFILLVACLHLHSILLRMLFLKPRLFGQSI